MTINIHKGRDGYGIYFAQQDGAMVVTKLDPSSEAVKAGVQVGDRLLRVQDNDKKMPIESPGKGDHRQHQELLDGAADGAGDEVLQAELPRRGRLRQPRRLLSARRAPSTPLRHRLAVRVQQRARRYDDAVDALEAGRVVSCAV